MKTYDKCFVCHLLRFIKQCKSINFIILILLSACNRKLFQFLIILFSFFSLICSFSCLNGMLCIYTKSLPLYYYYATEILQQNQMKTHFITATHHKLQPKKLNNTCNKSPCTTTLTKTTIIPLTRVCVCLCKMK